MLNVTALYTGILLVMLVVLSVYVVKGRWSNKVGLGDGANEDMLKRMRTHANFIEYVPLALLGMYLLEVTKHGAIVLHVLGIALVVARLLHAYGMNRRSPNFGRAGGATLTLIILLVEAILLILVWFRGLGV
jgi:uncharacterized membrane protein YecN with MAPEG domain